MRPQEPSVPELEAHLGGGHRHSTRLRAISANREMVVGIVDLYRGRDVRNFGSVATGEDTAASDIDLLVTFDQAPSLMALARLERELSEAVGYPVEVTPAGNLPTHKREQILEDSIDL